MLNIKQVCTAIFFSIFVCAGVSVRSQTNALTVDHRYSIPWWQTLICMPDDPVKTLVGKEGEIFGDYNYKGPRNFSFSIKFDSQKPAVWKSQVLASTSFPETKTVKESDGIRITEQTFLEIPDAEKLYSVVRFDSRRALRNWSQPKAQSDVAFKDAAEGFKGLSGEGLIELHVKVPAGSSHQLALGFCEGKYTEANQRPMRITVEGSKQKDVDPVSDFGAKTPGVYLFDAQDVNQDGTLIIVVTNLPGAKDRNAILNGLWMFKGKAPVPAAIIAGKVNKQAVVYAAVANIGMPQRRYHNLITLENTTNTTKTFAPVIRYLGIDPLKKVGSKYQLDEYTQLSASGAFGALKRDSATGYTLPMASIRLQAGERKQIDLSLSRFFPAGATSYVAGVGNTLQKQQRAAEWWAKNSPSAAAIAVPDPGVQSMVASSLRNIFQARDIRRGNTSFHVGPTQYRGLWIADGSFLLEVGTMLNYVKDVRSCIDYLTQFQLKDGGFDMITTFHKENGLVPFMLIRHAMLTQDKAWLSANWNVIEGCIKRVNALRAEAMKDPAKPYYGLLPNGNVDGGIQHGNDYSNTEWCLSGMKWSIQAAKWLGKEVQAAQWQADFDSLFANFTAKARKDIRKDEKGNTYLPVMIGNEQNHEAQRGQWAFCQSVYPGQLFDQTPEVHRWAEETVDMLKDHTQEGLVISTGWMTGGLWTYFASFQAHAMQWLGKTEGIPQLLYDFANHSSPTMVWREEQKPQGKGNDEVGDMPHNWASAEFIRMVVHMMQIDRGNELHLFEALPKQWVKAGSVNKLNKIRTPFGQINLSLIVNASGDQANLKLDFLDDRFLPAKVVLHQKTWGNAAITPMEIPVKQHIEQNISL